MRLPASSQAVIIPDDSSTGPTLWHFEADRESSSLELPLEDVKALARKIGFELSVRRQHFPLSVTTV